MSPNPKRAVLAVAVAAVVSLAAFAVLETEAAARPQVDHGLSCMYTRHWLWSPSSTGHAYTDPGDGYEEGDWTVEFRHRHVTNGWGDWLQVDEYGDVDILSNCSYVYDNTWIWAFASNVVDMDVIVQTEWRIDIKDEYPGNACVDDSSAPTMSGLYDSDYGVLTAVACTSRVLEYEYLVEVFHELE